MRTPEELIKIRELRQTHVRAKFRDPNRLWSKKDVEKKEEMDILVEEVSAIIESDMELANSMTVEELKSIIQYYGGEEIFIKEGLKKFGLSLVMKVTGPRAYYRKLAVMSFMRLSGQ